MLELVTVKFKERKWVGEFVATQMGLRVGDRCIVSTDRGAELGRVLRGRSVEQASFRKTRINKALRKATDRDLYLYEKKTFREERARRFCRKRIRMRKLPMKLSQVEYIFDGSLVVFYFTANQRVDFRPLVNDLARELRTRIEMNQIGARDEARLVGGLGACGTGENCSSKFLKELRTVTVKTVKAQRLGMNPTRLSGMCGRLKCCLNFESERGKGRN